MEAKPKIAAEIRQAHEGNKEKILIAAQYKTVLPSKSTQS